MIKEYRIHIVCLFFCCLSADEFLLAQIPVQCDHQAYLSVKPFEETGPFPLYKGDPAVGTSNPFEIYQSDAGAFLSCLGFSTNNTLYGLDPVKYEIYRITSEGNFENLGRPAGLDTSFNYRAGTMAPDGIRMVLVAQNKTTGIDERFFSVRTDLPDLQTGSTSIISDTPTRIGDVCFDPYFGNGYGFDELNQRLVNIGWPGGLVTSFGYEELNQITGMGGLFFDTLGVLYAYGSTSSNAAETTIFTLDKTNGNIIDSRGGPGGLESDGCNCPYRIQLNRAMSETKLLPCQEFLIEYAFWNTAGVVYPDISLLDILPPGFEIVEIQQAPYPPATFSQGVGGATLSYDEFDLLLGKDTLIIRVKAPEEAGTYSMQAFMDPFPAAFDYMVFSDDPFLPGNEDANIIEVIGEGSLFITNQTFLCPGSSIRLDPGISEGIFEWNDGSSLPYLDIATSGVYWLAITGPCGIYRDTIQVDFLPEPLHIDLGPDQEVRIGAIEQITFTSNTDFPLEYLWQTSGVSINCTDCPLPVAGPFLYDSQIILEASNDFGCYDSDTLNISVIKERAVYMPNTFSPDENGLNDRFYPQGLESASIRSFQVYNRWGQLIFEQRTGFLNEAVFGWDGKTSGIHSPEGVYIWKLSLIFDDDFEQQMSGDVLLIR